MILPVKFLDFVAQKRDCAKRARTKGLDHYGAKIFRSGILPLPKNPYFVTKIRPARRDELVCLFVMHSSML
jgi:hypothetical protein